MRTCAFVVVLLLAVDGRLGAQEVKRSGTASGTVTFARDVAPVLHKHCAACHHEGGSAPFSLVSYEEVRPRARQIADAVRRRTMPPWKPAAGYGGPFVGERSLRDDEIVRIETWAAGGALLGDPRDFPAPPPAVETDGWRIGKPDLILEMAAPYLLQPSVRDVFRNFVIPVPGADLRYVKAMDFQSSHPVLTHHATVRIDRTLGSTHLDVQDPEPGYTGPIASTAEYPDGHILAWTPGQTPQFLPDGLSWRLRPNSSFVIQMHLAPTERAVPIRIRIGLYFTETPPVRSPLTLRLARQDIDIAPGTSRYVIEDRYVLPVDVDVHAVQPHAHYLAKTIKGWATRPDGTTEWLIQIADWDFHWQELYRYKEPVKLPRGTVLQIEYTYDNSAGNRRNPFSPPQRVRFGEQTSDEMGHLWIQVLPKSSADGAVLARDYQRKELSDDLAGYKARLDVDPLNASFHDAIANVYLALGRIDDALAHLRQSVSLRPASDVGHYNLGTALLRAEQFEEAAEHFRRSLALNPNDASTRNSLAAALQALKRSDAAIEELHRAVRLDPKASSIRRNLARLLTGSGRVAEAVEQYRELVRLDPGDLEGHMSLGSLLESQGRYAEGLESYQRSASLAPTHPEALLRLGWLLATAPDERVRNGEEALGLAERARASVPPHLRWRVLDVLAAGYAATGQHGRAASAAEEALEQLQTSERSALAAGLRERLTLYRAGKPYYQPASPVR